MFSAIRESFPAIRSHAVFRENLFAGLTVGVIALPLSMALAIASGVAPQHGLYTAIVAGIVAALTGGSRVNITGPTAAFVVILLPVTQKYGLGGLAVSGLLAGVILVAMGMARMGTLIQVVPYPVVIGFTSGIGVVIATLQIKDLFGLSPDLTSGHYLETLTALIRLLPASRWEELGIGLLTFFVLFTWTRLKTKVPVHLAALIVGTLAAWLVGVINPDLTVATIGSRFHYVFDGVVGNGVPSMLPQFLWPWDLPGVDGNPIGLSFDLINTLAGSAFAIAMLGALESLLCATVADGMTGMRHNPNDELIGQGIGNIVTPFFGGIPATAAIARTAANVRTGGTTPVAAIVHALFVLAAILVLAPVLSYIPMSSMAALLVMVAWNMSEAKHFMRIVRIAPRDDVITLLTCFGLTVLFDMEVAVAVGIGLAAMLFIRRSIDLTGARLVERHAHPHAQRLPEGIVLYDIDGPLFFGAAQKALSDLIYLRPEIRVVILDMSDVTMLDMTALVAMESIVDGLQKKGVALVVNNLTPRIILKLRRAGLRKRSGSIEFARTMEQSVSRALKLLQSRSPASNA